MKILLLTGQVTIDIKMKAQNITKGRVYFIPPTYSSIHTETQFNYLKDPDCFIIRKTKPEYLVVSNALFFDFLEFNSWEEVRDTFYIFEDSKIKNIPETLAKEIWADVETDFLHVSEILRNKNLY